MPFTRSRNEWRCDRLRQGWVCRPHREIGLSRRVIISTFGALLPTIPYIASALGSMVQTGVVAGAGLALVTFLFVAVFVFSVYFAVISEEDHPYKYLILSMGLPGFLLAAASGYKALQTF